MLGLLAGSRRALASLPLVLVLAACGGGRGGGAGRDAGPSDADGGVRPSDGSVGADGATPTDGGGGTDAGVACSPTPGPAMGDAYCDLFELAIFDDGAGASEARLFGRVHPDGVPDDGCGVIDSVEVLEGATSIGTLPGVGAFSPGNPRAPLAHGPALPEMVARCGGDDERFGGFGLVVRGRVDGGTFEARCADAEGGGRWPPALRITCHENVDDRPFSSYASINSGGGFTFADISISVPHGPGGALTHVDDTIHVIPHAYPFGGAVVPDPFDRSGFATSVYESTGPVPGPYTDVRLSAMEDPFGLELCPFADTMPMPGPEYEPPPVMLLRITGTSERGAFSTEAYLDYCQRLPPSM